MLFISLSDTLCQLFFFIRLTVELVYICNAALIRLERIDSDTLEPIAKVTDCEKKNLKIKIEIITQN